MLEDRLRELRAPAATVHPWVLVDQSGAPIIVDYANGMRFAATYRTETAAKRGQARWGGTVVGRG